MGGRDAIAKMLASVDLKLDVNDPATTVYMTQDGFDSAIRALFEQHASPRWRLHVEEAKVDGLLRDSQSVITADELLAWAAGAAKRKAQASTKQAHQDVMLSRPKGDANALSERYDFVLKAVLHDLDDVQQDFQIRCQDLTWKKEDKMDQVKDKYSALANIKEPTKSEIGRRAWEMYRSATQAKSGTDPELNSSNMWQAHVDHAVEASSQLLASQLRQDEFERLVRRTIAAFDAAAKLRPVHASQAQSPLMPHCHSMMLAMNLRLMLRRELVS